MLLLVTALLVAAGALPALASSPTLYVQVLDMLRAGISEPVILSWLDGQPEPLPMPSSAELIALKEAGAGPDLLSGVLALAKGEPPPSAPPPSPAPARAAPTRTEEALVTFTLRYAPQWEEGDEPWDLFVYLDGKPLTYVPETGGLLGGGGLIFRRRLAAGPHLLRLAQERHDEDRKGRWEHAARFALEPFVFEVAPGGDGELEVDFEDRWSALAGADPLTVRFRQEDRLVDRPGLGGRPEWWPLLCEDLEAAVPDGEEPGRALRRELEQCTRWSALWPDLEAPPRHEVLEALAVFDYRPVPTSAATQ